MAERAEIVVEIVNRAKKELKNIRTEFKKLQAEVKKIDSDLDIDDNGSIRRTGAEIRRMARDRTATIYVRKQHLPSIDDLEAGGMSGLRSGDWKMPDLPNPTEAIDGRDRSLRSKLQRAGSKITDTGISLVPTYSQLLSVVIALLPMLITLAATAAGVAVAFGGIATAGAAMVGLGLFGRGNNLAEAMENARREAAAFKQELFAALRGPMRDFAPISEQALDEITNSIAGIGPQISSLDVFEGDLMRGIRGFVSYIGDGLEGLAAYQPVLSQLASRFGSIVGTNIAEFFQFLADAAYENQDLMIRLGQTFKMIFGIIWDLSVAISRIVMTFTPLLRIVQVIARLMNNDIAIALATATTAFLGMIGILYAYTTALAAAAAAKAALATLTLGPAGLAMVAGAAAASAVTYRSLTYDNRDSGRSIGGGPINQTTNIVVEGDVTPKVRREMDATMRRGMRERGMQESSMGSL